MDCTWHIVQLGPQCAKHACYHIESARTRAQHSSCSGSIRRALLGCGDLAHRDADGVQQVDASSVQQRACHIGAGPHRQDNSRTYESLAGHTDDSRV